MKNIGEYTGTPDDVLARYDDYLLGFKDDTGFSQKEWEIIYNHSGLVMDVLLARHRGELPVYWERPNEEKIGDLLVREDYRSQSREIRVISKLKVYAKLRNVLLGVSSRKQESDISSKIKKGEIALSIAQKSKDLRKVLEAYQTYPELLKAIPQDKLLVFRGSLEDSLKQAKKNVKGIIIKLIKIVDGNIVPTV